METAPLQLGQVSTEAMEVRLILQVLPQLELRQVAVVVQMVTALLLAEQVHLVNFVFGE
jgi:hypothetical protein